MYKKEKKIIGRSDIVNFPDLQLEEIAIKIDTGAYTSSIHCKDITEENGILKCSFLDEDHPQYNSMIFTFKEYKKITVRSSNGLAQERYEVKSTIQLFNKTYKISLSLNDRQEMKFPVLIGRKFLNDKFIVDTQLKDLSFQQQDQ